MVPDRDGLGQMRDKVVRRGAMAEVRIGTAGWSIPSTLRETFPPEGSQLERYAARFGAVEINSSFYRPHRRSTYARWAAAVGDAFRFAVKLPKAISHARYADGLAPQIDRFADEVSGLDDRLGVVLVQFPPSLAFDDAGAKRLFTALGARLPCRLVCEPRHPSWFDKDAERLLEKLRIARVAADPATAPGGGMPGGWPNVRYHRLHGSPRVYYSAYDAAALDAMRSKIQAEAGTDVETWYIFDNTALGAATANALELRDQLEHRS
jgi:uncharacterized protein YecE (DUF72 family)